MADNIPMADNNDLQDQHDDEDDPFLRDEAEDEEDEEEKKERLLKNGKRNGSELMTRNKLGVFVSVQLEFLRLILSSNKIIISQ